jgi:hypothetical protein
MSNNLPKQDSDNALKLARAVKVHQVGRNLLVPAQLCSLWTERLRGFKVPPPRILPINTNLCQILGGQTTVLLFQLFPK